MLPDYLNNYEFISAVVVRNPFYHGKQKNSLLDHLSSRDPNMPIFLADDAYKHHDLPTGFPKTRYLCVNQDNFETFETDLMSVLNTIL